MAAVPRVTGSKLLVRFGNDAIPSEVFDVKCMINAGRGIKFTTETSEEIMPDCTNPDDPAWKVVTKDGLSASISGSGKLNAADIAFFYAYLTRTSSKTIQFSINLTGANGGGYWQGKFHLSEFEVQSGGNKETAEASISLLSDGPVTWTANA